MNYQTISENIRRFRESRQWSQEELARASGVDVRTIQRSEGGKAKLALESLKAIAAAFDSTIEDLQLDQAEVARLIEEFTRRYKMLDLSQVTRSSQIGDMLTNAHATMFHRLGALGEKQLDEAAVLEDSLRDYLDIWSAFSAGDKRGGEQTLFEIVRDLQAEGVSTTWGLERTALRDSTIADPFCILQVAVAPPDAAASTLVLEKTRKLEFQ